MLLTLYGPELMIGLPSNIFAFLIVFSLALGLAFCLYHWKCIKPYKQFPSVHVEIKWIYMAIMRKYPKNVPFTSVFFQDIIKRCKGFQTEGFCVLWFFRPYLMIYSEEFSKTFSKLTLADKSSMYDISQDIFGNGLPTSKGEVWKVHRKLLAPAFYLGVLKGKMHIFNGNTDDLVEELQRNVDKPIEDMLFHLKYHTFNIMAESILGLNLNDEKYGPKVVNYMMMMDRVFKLLVYRIPRPWLHWEFLLPFFHSGRKYLEAVYGVRHFTNEIIQEMQKALPDKVEQHLDNEEEIRKSFAQILIEQNLKDSTFTIDDIRDHLIAFMVAGYDTSSHTLMWCLYLLGHHPEVQEKACKEIESVIRGKDVTYGELSELKYLECVIKETLRLYSTAPIYGRKLNEDVRCGKNIVPKGTEIVFFPFMLHRNRDVYPKPEMFDPERFSETSQVRPWMHIPFAEGYRSCIGKKFAMMEMKVLLVQILRRFEIRSLNKIEENDLDWTLVLKPTKPVRMLFSFRDSQSESRNQI